MKRVDTNTKTNKENSIWKHYDKQGNKYIETLRKRREKVHGNTIGQTRKNYIETLRQARKVKTRKL